MIVRIPCFLWEQNDVLHHILKYIVEELEIQLSQDFRCYLCTLKTRYRIPNQHMAGYRISVSFIHFIKILHFPLEHFFFFLYEHISVFE